MIYRTLTYAAEDGDIAVPVTIDIPRQGERDWSCAYEIGWPDGSRRGFGYGHPVPKTIRDLLVGNDAEQDG